MVKRTSLVWKRDGLSEAVFRELWLGEHVAHAKQLPGLLEYVIDFVTEGPPGSPAGLATVRFETREALDHAFQLPALQKDLLRTRETFADSVKGLFVDEYVVVRQPPAGGR